MGDPLLTFVKILISGCGFALTPLLPCNNVEMLPDGLVMNKI